MSRQLSRQRSVRSKGRISRFNGNTTCINLDLDPPVKFRNCIITTEQVLCRYRRKKSDDFVKYGRLYFCEQPWATSHSKYTLQIRKLMYKSACIQLSYKGYPIPLFSPIESVCNNEHPKNMSDKTSTLSRPGLPNFPKTLFALLLGDLDLLKSILSKKKK